MTSAERNKFRKDLIDKLDHMTHGQLLEHLPDLLIEIIHHFPVNYCHFIKGNRLHKLQNAIFESTQFLDKYEHRGFVPKLTTRIFYAMNRKTEIEHCQRKDCPNAPHNEYLKDISPVNTQKYFHCDDTCAQKDEIVICKIRNTKVKNHTTTKDLVPRQIERCQQKYGKDYFFQTDEFKTAQQQTWNAHYGCDHPMKSDDVKKKLGDTLEARYGDGVRSSWQIPEVKDNLKKHNQEKFGVDYPMQSKELHDIMHKNSNDTKLRRYYNDVILNFADTEPLFTEDDYANADRTSGFPLFKWRCEKCGDEFEQRLWLYKEPRCLKCDPLIWDSTTSLFEKEVLDEIIRCNANGYEIVYNSYENWMTLSNRKQLDVICFKDGIPKIAFEMNGVYWHQKKFKDATYHLDKTIQCEQLGIRLVHIWEDEWNNDAEKIKTLIAYAMTTDIIPYEFVHTANNRYEIDRSKFNKCWNFGNYDIVDCIDPICQNRIIQDRSFEVFDCGRFILNNKN